MAGEAGKAKHHAHIAPDTGGGSKQIIVVLGLVAVLGGFGIWYLNRAGEDNKLNTLFKSEDARKVSTNNGQRGEMTLSDSSVLGIAPATKLTIIPDYNKQYRGIKVEGGLKIDVKAVANTPLELRVGGASLVLSEGSVVARSYADENDGYIKLTSGSGELRAKEVRRQLTGPVSIHIGKDSSISDADAAAADAATAFADGKVVINNSTLGDVLPLYTKYFALTMDVTDKALLTRPVSLTAEFSGKKEAIAALEAAAFVKFGYEGSSAKPVLKDDPAAAAKAAKKK